MSENPKNGEINDVPGYSTLVVPQEYAQQLTDYLESLDRGGNGEDDVSGFMLSTGIGGINQQGSTQTQTASNCKMTTLGRGDVICDTDTFTPF